MPFFVSARELKRLERELSEARQGRISAEARLDVERKRADRLNLAVLDLAAKKLGAHAISTQIDPPEPEKPETEEEFRYRLKQEHHLWPFYLQAAQDAGKGEEEALDALVKHVRGEPLPFQTEQTM